MKIQVLFTCPVCHKANFSKPGLKAHRCDRGGLTDSTGKPTKRRLTAAELAEAYQHPQEKWLFNL